MNVISRVPATRTVNGVKVSAYVNPSLYLKISEFEPQEGDIIQVTFPRSGTHWVQQIIQLILNRGESAESFGEFTRRAPFLELHGAPDTEAPRLLRTHIPLEKLHLSKKAKYIYVARNPWDCCVSNFHMMQDLPGYQFKDGTFDEFLDAFLEGQFGFGNYFDHVLSGWKRRHDANFFFVSYEELHKNRAEVLLRLAEFLGEDQRKSLESSNDLFEKILRKSSFTFMKEMMRSNTKEMMEVFNKKSDCSSPSGEWSENGLVIQEEANLVRKGSVGGWRQYFSNENIEKMQSMIDE
ncbi:unnamed protein product, partial [Ixodes hexagonus]